MFIMCELNVSVCVNEILVSFNRFFFGGGYYSISISLGILMFILDLDEFGDSTKYPPKH